MSNKQKNILASELFISAAIYSLLFIALIFLLILIIQIV